MLSGHVLASAKPKSTAYRTASATASSIAFVSWYRRSSSNVVLLPAQVFSRWTSSRFAWERGRPCSC